MADEQEQQHETVTTITTERNQHELLHVGELRFEIDVRSDGPPIVVVVAVTISCCCCPAIVIGDVQIHMNHNNKNNITQ